jgi:hypothetical protein
MQRYNISTNIDDTILTISDTIQKKAKKEYQLLKNKCIFATENYESQ